MDTSVSKSSNTITKNVKNQSITFILIQALKLERENIYNPTLINNT